MTPLLTAADVRAAADLIAGRVHRTPVVTSRTLDDLTGATVLLKAENLQRAGAFKIRGATHRLLRLSPAERAAGVVAHSSGNHAQAVALAARDLGVRATVVMPHDAPAGKLAATRGYGAEVVGYDRYREDRAAVAAQLAASTGAVLVPPYDDLRVMAGAGTAGLELAQDAGPLDVLVVPAGGGGLLAGCATAVRDLCPGVRVVAAEPAASDDWCRSLAAGRRVRVEVGRTLADGQMLPEPGQLTWRVAAPLLDDAVTVTDAQLEDAVRLLVTRVRTVVEPSGACALAAVLAGSVPVAGRRVGVVLSGGNVDPTVLAGILSRG